MVIEEMSELTKELCKDLRDRGNIENIADEIADAMFPILSGYDVVPESEIPERCKTLYNTLQANKPKKKCTFYNLL